MNYHLPQIQESPTVSVDWSPVWEIILGISAYTHRKLRHTFDCDEEWSQAYLSAKLMDDLQMIEDTNQWFALMMLQATFSSSTVQDFSNELSRMEESAFYSTILPYKNRYSEPLRLQTSHNRDFHRYADEFNDHEFFGGYIASLAIHSFSQMKDLFHSVLSGWQEVMDEKADWGKWKSALEREASLHVIDGEESVMESVQQIIGTAYIPEPSIWEIKLIPQISYRPWLLEQRTPDTKLFFYPLREEYLLERGVPGKAMVNGYKALGDELRLKGLYLLQHGSLSLQELSITLDVSKTTLHHQLSLLKASKLVTSSKGVYSANPHRITELHEDLSFFLGKNHEE
jgi:DNA-binding transcriptional ArsR family regulator